MRRPMARFQAGSTASASASIVLGLRVMMSPAVVVSFIPFFSSIRRRSPSVMIPSNLPAASVTAVAPSRLRPGLIVDLTVVLGRGHAR